MYAVQYIVQFSFTDVQIGYNEFKLLNFHDTLDKFKAFLHFDPYKLKFFNRGLLPLS